MIKPEKNTIQHTLTHINEVLATMYPDEERRELARILIEEVTGLSRSMLLACPLQPLSDNEHKTIEQALSRLANHEPIQYVLGKAWFRGNEFAVNNSVLIPRPETEELVSLVLSTLKENPQLPKTVLDAGTGSGCIAISIKLEETRTEVSAFDYSPDAVQIAEKNAKALGADVKFFINDIFNFTEKYNYEKLGVLVSNPPYIRESEKTHMRNNVLDFEPVSALFVPDKNALCYYEALKQMGEHILIDKGFLIVEINEALGDNLIQLFSQSKFSVPIIHNDMRGKPRFLSTQYCKNKNI